WAVGSAMAMLPWLFAASEWLRQRSSRRAVAALALAVAVSIFAGYPQITAVALLVTGAWALVRAPATRRPWSFLGAWASGAVIGGAWRGPGTRFFLGLALVAAVLCYDTPGVTGWLGALPPFSFVITFRMVVFFAFALSVLAALGLEALATASPEVRRRMERAVRWSVVALAALTCVLVVQDYPIFVRGCLVYATAGQYVLFLALLAVATLSALAPAGSRAAW